MNIITGQKFQELCNHYLSIKEFMPFEIYPSDKHIDVRDFDFTNFDNEEYIHINNDLANDLNAINISSKVFSLLYIAI